MHTESIKHHKVYSCRGGDRLTLGPKLVVSILTTFFSRICFSYQLEIDYVEHENKSVNLSTTSSYTMTIEI